MANEKSIVNDSSVDAKKEFIQGFSDYYDKYVVDDKPHTLTGFQKNRAFGVAEKLMEQALKDPSKAEQLRFQAVVYFLLAYHERMESALIREIFQCIQYLIPQKNNNDSVGFITPLEGLKEKITTLFADNSCVTKIRQAATEIVEETKIHRSLIGKMFFHFGRKDLGYEFFDGVRPFIKDIKQNKKGDAEAFYYIGLDRWKNAGKSKYSKKTAMEYLFAASLLQNEKAISALQAIHDNEKDSLLDSIKELLHLYLAEIYMYQLMSDNKLKDNVLESLKKHIVSDDIFFTCIRMIPPGWGYEYLKFELGLFALKNSSCSPDGIRRTELLSEDAFIASCDLIKQGDHYDEGIDLFRSVYLKHSATKINALMGLIERCLVRYSQQSFKDENLIEDYISQLVDHFYLLIAAESKQKNPNIRNIREIVEFIVTTLNCSYDNYLFNIKLKIRDFLYPFRVVLTELFYNQFINQYWSDFSPLLHVQQNSNNQNNIEPKILELQERDANALLRNISMPFVKTLLDSVTNANFSTSLKLALNKLIVDKQFWLGWFEELYEEFKAHPGSEKVSVAAFAAFEACAKYSSSGLPYFLLACYCLLIGDVSNIGLQCLDTAVNKGFTLAQPLSDLLSKSKNPHKENVLSQRGCLSDGIVSALSKGSFTYKFFSSGLCLWPDEKISNLSKELIRPSTTHNFWKVSPNNEFKTLLACIKEFADDLTLPDTFKVNLARVIVDLTEIIHRNNLVDFQDRLGKQVESQNANDRFEF